MSGRFAVAMVAFTIATTFGSTQIASGFSHSGTVVDASTKKPIPDVWIVAATSNKIIEKGDCPKYDGYVSQTSSGPKGAFTLRVPDNVRAYRVTYCRAQYEVFTPAEPNENTRDGETITPAPIRLWPLNGEGSEMRDALALLRDDTKAAVLALRRESDPATFAAATKMLPEAERRLVEEWLRTEVAYRERDHVLVAAIVRTVAPQPEIKLSLTDLNMRLRRALASERVTLKYLETASPEHFRQQLRNFPDLNGYVRPTPEQKPQAAAPPPVTPVPAPLPEERPNACDTPREAVGAAVDLRPAELMKVPSDITISQLDAVVERPSDLSSNTPRTKFESRLLRVTGVVVKSTITAAGDIRLVLTDGDHKLTAVVPVACVENSPLLPAIQRVWYQFRQYPPPVGTRLALDGFLFFPSEKLDGDAELRPVVRIANSPYLWWGYPQ